jgi:2-phospho-L-lactate guanylyltransferase
MRHVPRSARAPRTLLRRDPRAAASASSATVGAGVVIPLRSFALAKGRLARHLDAAARAELARRMAERVVAAAGELPVAVVSSDPDVRAWARHAAVVLPDPGSLDAAAGAGRLWARREGLDRVVVAHADLPLADSLAPVAGGGADPIATIVACHRGDGTPVLAIPAASEFRFAYGTGSFQRHCAEAARVGLRVDVVSDPTLSFDVDVPEDLELLEARATEQSS